MCDICGKALQDVAPERYIIRQIIDIPDIKVQVIERQAEVKKRQWLHVASKDKYTYYQAHEKRGQKATDDMNILLNFIGIAVHDESDTCFYV